MRSATLATDARTAQPAVLLAAALAAAAVVVRRWCRASGASGADAPEVAP